MHKSRILVCGGRDFNDEILFYKSMSIAEQWFMKKFCIIQGQARGADRMAAIWAFQRGCAMLAIPANWDAYAKAAGTVRNTWMLDFGLPDLVIAFPGGDGTFNMTKQSRKRGIDVWEPK